MTTRYCFALCCYLYINLVFVLLQSLSNNALAAEETSQEELKQAVTGALLRGSSQSSTTQKCGTEFAVCSQNSDCCQNICYSGICIAPYIPTGSAIRCINHSYCTDGFYCSTDGVCEPKKPLMGLCNSNVECQADLECNSNNYCDEKWGINRLCGQASECPLGMYCDGRCTPLLSRGSSCYHDGQCIAGLYCISRICEYSWNYHYPL